MSSAIVSRKITPKTIDVYSKVSSSALWFTNISRKLNNKKKHIFAKAKMAHLEADLTNHYKCLRESKSITKKVNINIKNKTYLTC